MFSTPWASNQPEPAQDSAARFHLFTRNYTVQVGMEVVFLEPSLRRKKYYVVNNTDDDWCGIVDTDNSNTAERAQATTLVVTQGNPSPSTRLEVVLFTMADSMGRVISMPDPKGYIVIGIGATGEQQVHRKHLGIPFQRWRHLENAPTATEIDITDAGAATGGIHYGQGRGQVAEMKTSESEQRGSLVDELLRKNSELQQALATSEANYKKKVIDIRGHRQKREAATNRDLAQLQGSIQSFQQQTQILQKENASLRHGLEDLQQQLDSSRYNEVVTRGKLDDTQRQLDEANERIRKIKQGQKLMLSATGEHDFGSTFPSPGELVATIGIIERQGLMNWFDQALDVKIPSQATLTNKGQRDFVLQVLVETVRECHERVQKCVSTKAEKMEDFMGGAKSRLAEKAKLFTRSTFSEAYMEMFAEICPVDEDSQIHLARGIFHHLPACVGDCSPLLPAQLLDNTQRHYVAIVTNLLKTFLECKIHPTDSLKLTFPDTTWNSKNSGEFQKEDLEDDKPKEGDRVEVLVPRLFSVDGDGAETPLTKASFIICDKQG